MKSTLLFVLSLWLVYSGCKSTPESVVIEDIASPPRVTEADQKYAGAFFALEGVWEGVFSVYEDSLGQTEGISQPQNLMEIDLAELNLRPLHMQETRLEYVSKNPYFQQVTIRDVHTDENGQKREVVSRGAYKVQDGKLWYALKKSDETLVYQGKRVRRNIVFWQRDSRDPLQIEYYAQMVEGDFYKIWGWGYYRNDDINLTPRVWFVGDYYKIQ